MLASGQSTINSGYATTSASGTTSTLNVAALARNTGATVNFIGGTSNVTPLGTASNQLVFGNLSANPVATTPLQFVGNQGNILPFAEVNGTNSSGDLATYTSLGVATFSNYNTLIYFGSGPLPSTLGAGDIVKIIYSGTKHEHHYARKLKPESRRTRIDNRSNGNAILAPATSGTLTFASGTILTESTANNGSSTSTQIGSGTSGTAINMPGETFLFQNSTNSNTSTATILYGPLTGSGSLAISGFSNVYLENTANSYTGGTSLNAGAVNAGGNANFGSGAITLNGGTTFYVNRAFDFRQYAEPQRRRNLRTKFQYVHGINQPP